MTEKDVPYYFLHDLFMYEDRLVKQCGLIDNVISRQILKQQLWDVMGNELHPLLPSRSHEIMSNIKTLFMTNKRTFAKTTGQAIFYYGIGRPVSSDEARQCFVYSTIYPFLIPKDQKKFLKTEQGVHKLYNILTTEQQQIHEGFVQLRQTGRLIEKELFEYYITTNKTTWCNKPSVGFVIGPEDDAFVYGNLVCYNFNDAFLPQEPGTLVIEKIPNFLSIKISTKDENTPTFFFQCSYMIRGIVYIVFYIPDTDEGRIILGLMKDAFKKQNLFAMDTTRKRVRMGRIHKKTSLYGDYGFPDGTYLERVAGELFRIGSSPFVHSFSHDKNYDPGVDPYPEEKRFIITYK